MDFDLQFVNSVEPV